MKRIAGGQLMTAFAVGAIAVGNFSAPIAVAQEATTLGSEEIQLAQGLVGQCRAAKRDIFIYSERSTGSTKIRALSMNTEVTLAGNGANGWIAVSAPATGFVQTADLKSCGSSPQPPTKNLCRKLNVAMNIRATPRLNGRYLTTLAAGRQVTLKTDTETMADGRYWVEITSPVQGWLSSRPATGNSNIGNCTSSPNPPAPSPKSCKVAYPLGLRVWNSPTGNPISGVAFNQTVSTTGQRRTIGNRVWLEITSPVKGWVSSGFIGRENNLSPNPCR
ncbi:hypothetical protein IQ249_15560 [Lusitaniella coriacea LEGE 07157]|uniref:SH3 domain-containing protein n=1 Tax=Lusitaniella coriacea LEGE 07157 TaxID=945747 RepID=A0A8J7JCB3_9CYAN|nr:hypothetical protein [Lusitaniella coriacea]MBE9117315.1 hypothetical protein [Lusitaniella coriacea LEGE 07157]